MLKVCAHNICCQGPRLDVTISSGRAKGPEPGVKTLIRERLAIAEEHIVTEEVSVSVPTRWSVAFAFVEPRKFVARPVVIVLPIGFHEPVLFF